MILQSLQNRFVIDLFLWVRMTPLKSRIEWKVFLIVFISTLFLSLNFLPELSFYAFINYAFLYISYFCYCYGTIFLWFVTSFLSSCYLLLDFLSIIEIFFWDLLPCFLSVIWHYSFFLRLINMLSFCDLFLGFHK